MAQDWDFNGRNSNQDGFAGAACTGDAGGEATPAACTAWVSLLPDAAEDRLSEAEQTALDRHLALCPQCTEELADAKRGAAWLGLLKGHAPEPSPALLSSILAKTSGLRGAEAGLSPWIDLEGEPALVPVIMLPLIATLGQPATPEEPSGQPSLAERLGRWFGLGNGFAPALQPRLTMTAAMAFLSICLTLNLLGLPDRTLHAQTFHTPTFHTQTLRPMGLQRTVADKRATLVRTFEGIRVVYRVESRMNEWLTASAAPNDAPWTAQR